MYQRIDFTKLGGFPLTQDTMEFIQNSFNDVFEAVSYIAGARVIISGVVEAPPNVFSAGWICIDGEILPFDGGTALTNLSIVETSQPYTFRDGVSNTVLFERKAIFDTSGSIPWSSFKRLSLESLKIYIDQVNTAAQNAQTTANTALAAAGSFSPGMIMLWSGNPASVPAGWALCDGLDGRPNLKGKFIVGFSATTGTYQMGSTGGLASVTLTTTQMPSHTHSMSSAGNHQHYVKEVDAGDEGSSGTDQSVGSYNESGTSKFTNFSGDHTHSINSAGSGAAHENRPPYYTLAYIIKVA